MNGKGIDVWGCCPECGDKWDKKKYSNITLVKYFHPVSYALKCPKCSTVWPVDKWPKTTKHG